jgi:hypothetical protein
MDNSTDVAVAVLEMGEATQERILDHCHIVNNKISLAGSQLFQRQVRQLREEFTCDNDIAASGLFSMLQVSSC